MAGAGGADAAEGGPFPVACPRHAGLQTRPPLAAPRPALAQQYTAPARIHFSARSKWSGQKAPRVSGNRL